VIPVRCECDDDHSTPGRFAAFGGFVQLHQAVTLVERQQAIIEVRVSAPRAR